MEARIARIESDVAHMRGDIADIKVDFRARFDRLDTRMDRFESKLDGFDTKLGGFDSKLETLKDAVQRGDALLAERIMRTEASLREAIASARIWALLLYVALAAAMLGTMARGFGWL